MILKPNSGLSITKENLPIMWASKWRSMHILLKWWTLFRTYCLVWHLQRTTPKQPAWSSSTGAEGQDLSVLQGTSPKKRSRRRTRPVGQRVPGARVGWPINRLPTRRRKTASPGTRMVPEPQRKLPRIISLPPDPALKLQSRPQVILSSNAPVKLAIKQKKTISLARPSLRTVSTI